MEFGDEIKKGLLPTGTGHTEHLTLGEIKKILSDNAGKHLLLQMVDWTGVHYLSFHNKNEIERAYADCVLRICGYYTLIYETGFEIGGDNSPFEIIPETQNNILLFRIWERWAMNPTEWKYIEKYHFATSNGHISSYHLFCALAFQASKIYGANGSEAYRFINYNKDKFDRR